MEIHGVGSYHGLSRVQQISFSALLMQKRSDVEC